MRMVICYLLLFVLINHYRNASEGFIHIGFSALGKNHTVWGGRGRSQLSSAALARWVLSGRRPPTFGPLIWGRTGCVCSWRRAPRRRRPSHLRRQSPDPSPAPPVAWPEPDRNAPQGFTYPSPKWLKVGAGDAGRAPGGTKEGAGRGRGR